MSCASSLFIFKINLEWEIHRPNNEVNEREEKKKLFSCVNGKMYVILESHCWIHNSTPTIWGDRRLKFFFLIVVAGSIFIVLRSTLLTQRSGIVRSIQHQHPIFFSFYVLLLLSFVDVEKLHTKKKWKRFFLTKK
jgi:hypothetical protein